MNRTAIALVATATLGLGGLGAVTLLPETAAQAEASSTLRTQVFSIEKMTCATCPITVKTAMERVEGVRSANVDFDTKTATVVYDPRVTNLGAIAAASTKAGYPARVTGG
jgi:mercuric ion binding protein